VDGQAQAGRVIVLYGGAGRKQELARPHPVGLWQPPVAGDQFGYAADALEDVGQGGTPDPDAYAVAIGAPGTNVGGDDDAGWVGFLVAVVGGNVLKEATQVQVFPVADLDAESSYAQNSPGVPGGVHAGDKFGTTLALMAGASERALIIGVPDDVDNSNGMVNVIPLGGGTPRYWAPGVNLVPAGGASRFGGAPASVNGGST
jgi:hypothetical protein